MSTKVVDVSVDNAATEATEAASASIPGTLPPKQEQVVDVRLTPRHRHAAEIDRSFLGRHREQ